MIDSRTKKRVVAVQEGELISIKVYSWRDLPILEDYLEDKLKIQVESFKPIKDENGNEIGSELFYAKIHSQEIIQNTIDEIE